MAPHLIRAQSTYKDISPQWRHMCGGCGPLLPQENIFNEWIKRKEAIALLCVLIGSKMLMQEQGMCYNAEVMYDS